MTLQLPEPATISLIPDKLRFEVVPNTFVEVDIIEAELEIEEYLRTLKDAKEGKETHLLLDRIKIYLANQVGSCSEFDENKISTTTAWRFFSAVRAAYDLLKKKFSGSLLQAFGLESTPEPSLPEDSKSTKNSWWSSWRRRKSETATPQPTQHQNGSNS